MFLNIGTKAKIRLKYVMTAVHLNVQCEQIGLFLKRFGNKFWATNIGNVSKNVTFQVKTIVDFSGLLFG